MQLGEFLQRVFEWLYEFWPLRIVNDWEQGIRLRGGRITRVLTSKNGLFKTGLHVFWPMFGEIITENSAVDVNETPMQTHTTSDGTAVSFSLGIKYSIHDLGLLYLHVKDHHETILTEAQGCAGQLVAEMKYTELDEKLALTVYEYLNESLEEWGIELEDVTLINLTAAQALRLIGDG